jgi:5-methylthioadenosine/S-adenosylhomocysteine deaminase
LFLNVNKRGNIILISMMILIKDAILVSYIDDVLIQKRGSILVDGSVIAEVGDLNFESRASRADTVIDGRDMIVIPGFVNLHAHSGPTAIRGLAEDLPLSKWLERYVDPAHRSLSREDAEVDYELAYLEMLKSGITHVLDMYRFPEVGIAAANQLGIRTTIAPYTADVYDYFESPDDTANNVSKHSNFSGLGRVWPGFEHISYCTEACLEQMSKLAREYGTGIHTHEFETLDFVERVVKMYGKRPLSIFREFGMLDQNLILAHCVWPMPEELRTMADAGVSVAHNPTSNMKLASGPAPITQMLRLGMNVGLGTDGVKENNRLDLFQEMKNASLMQRVMHSDASLISSSQAFWMATVAGNRALKMKAGQLRKGYLADMVLIDASAPNMNPLYMENAISAIVYSAHPGNVRAVMVNGKIVVQNGFHVEAKEQEIVQRARSRGSALLSKMGL